VLATFHNNGGLWLWSLLSQGRHSETAPTPRRAVPAETADQDIGQPLNARQYPDTAAQLDNRA
jgi:hypothetical protein